MGVDGVHHIDSAGHTCTGEPPSPAHTGSLKQIGSQQENQLTEREGRHLTHMYLQIYWTIAAVDVEYRKG